MILKRVIKFFLYPILHLRRVRLILNTIHIRDPFCNKAKIQNKGIGKIIKKIWGDGHKIVIEEGTYLDNTIFQIRGKHNTIHIGKNCRIGKDCSFWLEGENLSIVIGDLCTFTQTVHFCVQEKNVSIIVNENCMFSNNIIVRTSDSHPIYELITNKRLNPAQSIIIGKNVWIAPKTTIMKGVNIGDNSIIGSNSLVTKNIPMNCLAVGMPAKVVKDNIYWTRELLF